MNKLYISTLFLFFGLAVTMGQSTESFLEKVKLNHPAIVAAKQLLSSGEAESRTGITPNDPIVRAGYFPGNDAAGENKLTWGVSQSFDFPTRYARLKKLKRTNLELAKMEYQLTIIQLLSEARLAAISFVSSTANIRKDEYRLQNLEKLEQAYSSMLKNGETTIIDYNKIVIKKVELQSALNSLKAETALLKAQLDFMSSNNGSMLEDADYPVFEEPEIESLNAELQAKHPAFLLPGIRLNAAVNEIDLTRSERMPAFELGYSSEIVGNTRFTGPSVGLSVPLWKNKGKVKKALEGSTYQERKAESDIIMLESYFSSLFNNYLATDENLSLVENTINASGNINLLDKALNAGEISLTNYFLELESIYQLVDISIELNDKKHRLLSQLFELDFKE